MWAIHTATTLPLFPSQFIPAVSIAWTFTFPLSYSPFPDTDSEKKNPASLQCAALKLDAASKWMRVRGHWNTLIYKVDFNSALSLCA